MSPQRIQLRRTKGWRKPEGAVVVSRPSKWGNPYKVVPAHAGGWKVVGNGSVAWSADETPWTKARAAEYAVASFRQITRPNSIRGRDIQIALAGRDLACWCPLDSPCHADVLLEIANATQDEVDEASSEMRGGR